METQRATSPHLTAARRLLDDIGEATDPQVKASAANAHAVLVLAEQVAAARLVLAADAVNGQQQEARRELAIAQASTQSAGTASRPATTRSGVTPSRVCGSSMRRQRRAQHVRDLDALRALPRRVAHRVGEDGAKDVGGRARRRGRARRGARGVELDPRLASARAAHRSSPPRRIPSTTCSGPSAGACSARASACAYSKASRTSGVGTARSACLRRRRQGR